MRQRAMDLLTQIDENLRSQYFDVAINPSFADGHPGVAMFYAYYYKLTLKNEHLDICHRLIDRLVDYLADNDTNFSYSICSGVTGVVWTLQHLMKEKILQEDDTVFAEIDELLRNVGKNRISLGDFDYLHGGLGCAIYLLDKANNSDVVDEMLEALNQSSKTDEVGKYWIDIYTTLLSGDKRPTVNFGLAHGQPSIIYFLAKVVEKGYGGTLAIKMLKDSINYLLVHSDISTGVPSFFPTFRYAGDMDVHEPKEFSRLAWCYGDLGVVFSLFFASRALKDDRLQEIALKISLKSTERKKFEETQIMDGGLCHGFAGVAHLYNRLYMQTENSIFLNTSNYWANELIDYIVKIGGINCFNEYHRGEGYKLSKGFLAGSAGAGLMLISVLENSIKPNWDRFLLLS
ncbi:MAG: lanthionine synthetase C family protein [Flammeovirgaceae bacterium]